MSNFFCFLMKRKNKDKKFLAKTWQKIIGQSETCSEENLFLYPPSLSYTHTRTLSLIDKPSLSLSLSLNHRHTLILSVTLTSPNISLLSLCLASLFHSHTHASTFYKAHSYDLSLFLCVTRLQTVVLLPPNLTLAPIPSSSSLQVHAELSNWFSKLNCRFETL